MIDVILESITREKFRHLIGVTTAGTGTAVATKGSPANDGIFEIAIHWLPHAAVFMGFAVSCALFYKTYLEIRRLKAEIAREEE
jgi:hypothetical protein